MDGKVSMNLVSSKVARREIEDLKTATFSNRFELVFEDFDQVYQLPASYMAKEGIISVVVDIPMVPITDYGKFALFKHDSLPFQLDGRLVRVKGESNMVAVLANKDEMVEVSRSDLHSCLHIGPVFLCHYLGVKISASFPCCLCDIFTGKTSEVMRDCDLTFLSERFRLDRINSTSFLFYANSSQSGILSCGVSQEQLRLTGFGVRSLNPGCVLMVAGVTLFSAVAPRVGVQQVVTLFSWNFSFSDDIEALTRSLSKALEDFDQIDYNALLYGGRSFGTCNLSRLRYHICGPFGWGSWDSPC